MQIQLKYGMHRNTRDLDAVEELSCTSEAAMYIYIYNHLNLYTYLNTTCITYIYIYIYEYYVNIKIIMLKKQMYSMSTAL